MQEMERAIKKRQEKKTKKRRLFAAKVAQGWRSGDRVGIKPATEAPFLRERGGEGGGGGDDDTQVITTDCSAVGDRFVFISPSGAGVYSWLH